jgi:pimeloyl-ACP methyl ester carboxylesterase
MGVLPLRERESHLVPGDADSNLAAVRADLALALAEGNLVRQRLLQTLVGCRGAILLYRPDRDHYAVQFGEFEDARHVAVVVPGVGDDTNLCQDWVPGAHNLFAAAPSTTVIMWKGYDNPNSIMAAALGSVECNEHLMAAGGDLAEFVRSLPVQDHRSVTIVAHSFGSLVTGAALADHGLQVTDVVVAGSPGMSVDGLRELHLSTAHFFSEEAPGDAIAELGIFGPSPTSPFFGGTRMRTNAPGHVEVHAHSSYFVPGSEALENIVDVVTGRYARIERHSATVPEIAGGAVSWFMRLPTVPVRLVGRHYRGPGFRLGTNAIRLVDFAAARAEGVVRDAFEEAEDVLAWVAHRVGGGPAAS